VQLKSILESLLFVADHPVTVESLASALQADVQQVEAALEMLGTECRERGIRLQRKGDRVQLVTAPEAAQAVEAFLGLEVSRGRTGDAEHCRLSPTDHTRPDRSHPRRGLEQRPAVACAPRPAPGGGTRRDGGATDPVWDHIRVPETVRARERARPARLGRAEGRDREADRKVSLNRAERNSRTESLGPRRHPPNARWSPGPGHRPPDTG